MVQPKATLSGLDIYLSACTGVQCTFTLPMACYFDYRNLWRLLSNLISHVLRVPVAHACTTVRKLSASQNVTAPSISLYLIVVLKVTFRLWVI